jgi:hypothetical protein
MRRTLTALTALCVLAASAPARAGGDEVKKAAKTALVRARRMISLGPTVGGAFIVAPDGGHVDGAVSLGLSVIKFKDDLFDVGSWQERIQERVKEKLQKRLLELALDPATVDPETMKKIGAEVLEEVKAEILAEFEARPKINPKPSFLLGLEVARQLDSTAWQIRLGFGIGVGPIAFGPSAVVHIGDDSAVALGPEIDYHLLLGKGPRPLTLQIFLRYDFFLGNRDVLPDQASLGLRVLPDIL